MGDGLRKVPPPHVSVDAKLAAMDVSGIEVTMLGTNDPGPEWFGDDGPAVAQLEERRRRSVERRLLRNHHHAETRQ